MEGLEVRASIHLLVHVVKEISPLPFELRGAIAVYYAIDVASLVRYSRPPFSINLQIFIVESLQLPYDIAVSCLRFLSSLSFDLI